MSERGSTPLPALLVPSMATLPVESDVTSSANDVPQQDRTLLSTMFPPASSAQRVSGTRVRNKVALEPGHSPMDWAKLQASQTNAKAPSDKYSLADVALHSAEQDAWCAISNKIYNITPYLKFHPGGVKKLMKGAGKDGTKLFMAIHPWVNVDKTLETCFVGYLAVEAVALDVLQSRALNGRTCRRVCSLAQPSRRKKREKALVVPWRKRQLLLGDALCTFATADIRAFFIDAGIDKQSVIHVFASNNGNHCVLVRIDGCLTMLAVQHAMTYILPSPLVKDTLSTSYSSDLREIVVSDNGINVLYISKRNDMYLFTGVRVTGGQYEGAWNRLDFSDIAAKISPQAFVKATFNRHTLIVHFMSQHIDSTTAICQAIISLDGPLLITHHTWILQSLAYTNSTRKGSLQARQRQQLCLNSHVRMQPLDVLRSEGSQGINHERSRYVINYDAKNLVTAIIVNSPNPQETFIAIIHGTSPIAYIFPIGQLFIEYNNILTNVIDTSLYVEDTSWLDTGHQRTWLCIINGRGQLAFLTRVGEAVEFLQNINSNIAAKKVDLPALVYTVSTLLASTTSLHQQFSVSTLLNHNVHHPSSELSYFRIICSDGVAITEISVHLRPHSSPFQQLDYQLSSTVTNTTKNLNLLSMRWIELMSSQRHIDQSRSTLCDPRKRRYAICLVTGLLLQYFNSQHSVAYACHFINQIELTLLSFWEPTVDYVEWEYGWVLLRDHLLHVSNNGLKIDQPDHELTKLWLEITVMHAPTQCIQILPSNVVSASCKTLEAGHTQLLLGNTQEAILAYCEALTSSNDFTAMPYLFYTHLKSCQLLNAFHLILGTLPTLPQSRLRDVLDAYRLQHKPDLLITQSVLLKCPSAIKNSNATSLHREWVNFCINIVLTKRSGWSQGISVRSVFEGEQATDFNMKAIAIAVEKVEDVLPLFDESLVLELGLVLCQIESISKYLDDLGDWINGLYLSVQLANKFEYTILTNLNKCLQSAAEHNNLDAVRFLMSIANCKDIPVCALDMTVHFKIVSQKLDAYKNIIMLLPLEAILEESVIPSHSSLVNAMQQKDITTKTGNSQHLSVYIQLISQLKIITMLFGYSLDEIMNGILSGGLPLTELGAQAVRLCRYLWFVELRSVILNYVERSLNGNAMSNEVTELVMLMMGFDDIADSVSLCKLAKVTLSSYKKKRALSIIDHYTMYFSADMHDKLRQTFRGRKSLDETQSANSESYIRVCLRDPRFIAFTKQCLVVWQTIDGFSLPLPTATTTSKTSFSAQVIDLTFTQLTDDYRAGYKFKYALTPHQTLLPLISADFVNACLFARRDQVAETVSLAKLSERIEESAINIYTETAKFVQTPDMESVLSLQSMNAAEKAQVALSSKLQPSESLASNDRNNMSNEDESTIEWLSMGLQQRNLAGTISNNQEKQASNSNILKSAVDITTENPTDEKLTSEPIGIASIDSILSDISPFDALAESLRDLALNTQLTITELKQRRQKRLPVRERSKRSIYKIPRSSLTRASFTQAEEEHQKFLHMLLQKQIYKEAASLSQNLEKASSQDEPTRPTLLQTGVAHSSHSDRRANDSMHSVPTVLRTSVPLLLQTETSVARTSGMN